MGGASDPGMTTESQVKCMLDRSPLNKYLHKWVSFGNSICGVKLNWVTSLLAVVLTWGFAIICLADKSNAPKNFSDGKSWVSQNFTWLYIGTQDVWCLFLIYLCFSRFGKIKLGKEDEKPRYNDFTWFAMLFTCGVAVGLYVFGVAEPLYFYRQPTLWHTWAYDYAHTKTSVDSDAQRAQQAIFMAVYHWGIHGWVPYILLALLIGVVSFRWNMPMTIRSCFYPLIGDHALGIFGDLIDSISIATTTFGVCTSLGLGVTQLSAGLQFWKRFTCKEKENCVSEGGFWRSDTYGANRCFTAATGLVAKTYDNCAAEWLASDDNKTDSYYVIIGMITIVATISVILGLDRGIKTLANTAFLLGAIVMLTCLYSDNTFYLLSIMVQTTGYYLQYVVQVGFDCEAFQQLNFELMPGSNHFWGATGTESIAGKLALANIPNPPATAMCGDQVNPCTAGALSSVWVAALALGSGPQYTDAVNWLTTRGMSARSISLAATKATQFRTVYGASASVPCGYNAPAMVHDAFTASLYSATTGANVCAGLTGASLTACTSAWGGDFPRCPETTFGAVNEWGSCATHYLSCSRSYNYYDDGNPEFMNFWTIFYWAWWITWAPFVGFFVALISRGRTVREVIVGGFVCPTLFAIIWFSVFGGLAIKMERTAELALGQKPDIAHALVTCSEHYSGGVPITPESKRLADVGYYMLTCMPRDDQIYRLMEPYTNRTEFIQFFLWLGLIIYFITSSDSGSMTDDIISASGLAANKIPIWQKCFWCFTEGLVAIALVNTGGALKSLQHVSIIIGLPYTFFLCMMVPALYRALKREAGDTDIAEAKRFNTQLFDIMELFKPNGGSPFSPAQHIVKIVLALLAPFLPIKAALGKAYPKSPIFVGLLAVTAQLLYVAWFVLQICEVRFAGVYILSWVMFSGYIFIVIFARAEMRRIYNVWGSYVDDLYVSIFGFPVVLAQLQMAAETDNKDAPTYFASADLLAAELANLGDEELPTAAKPGVSSSIA
jgi:choline-glycine betaine transporter